MVYYFLLSILLIIVGIKLLKAAKKREVDLRNHWGKRYDIAEGQLLTVGFFAVGIGGVLVLLFLVSFLLKISELL